MNKSMNKRNTPYRSNKKLRNLSIKIKLESLEKRKTEASTFLSALREMRKGFVKNIVIGQFNINSLRNKFSSIKDLLSQNSDTLIIN